MYIPKHFNVDEFELQADLIENYPLGTLITGTPHGGFLSKAKISLTATHLPFKLVVKDDKKYLVTHLAIENQQVADLELTEQVLVTFQSPSTYISPSWYVEDAEDAKLVPTWNFAAVHVYGKPKVVRDDPLFFTEAFNLMTEQEELKRPLEKSKKTWQVGDADEKYVNILMKRIVGLTIEITEIQGKFKFDQQKPQDQIKGVIDLLENEVGGDTGRKLAQMTTQFYPKEL